MLNLLMKKLGYIKKSEVDATLNFARSVAKRLDEHRETVEDLEKSGFFNKEYWWRANHMATQDDYLMRLFYFVHGYYPDNRNLPTTKFLSVSNDSGRKKPLSLCDNNGKRFPIVRERPKILGECRLPEYINNPTQPTQW